MLIRGVAGVVIFISLSLILLVVGNMIYTSVTDRVEYQQKVFSWNRTWCQRHFYRSAGEYPVTSNCSSWTQKFNRWVPFYYKGWSTLQLRTPSFSFCPRSTPFFALAITWLNLYQYNQPWPSTFFFAVSRHIVHSIRQVIKLISAVLPFYFNPKFKKMSAADSSI